MKSFSVTTVLSAFTDFDMIRPDVLQAAQLRGSGVHAAAAAFSSGLYVKPLPMEWQGYFDSFRKWFDLCVDQVIFTEERFFDQLYCYNGKPDLGVLLMDGRRVVVDYKTAVTEAPTWKSQVSAYCELAENKYPPHFDGMSLRLKKNGKMPKANIYNSTGNDYAAFLAALTAYRYFKS